MNEQEHVTAGEFTRSIESIERQLTAGFERTSREIANVSRGLHKRLDMVDDTQGTQGERIAALEERTRSAARSAGIRGASWGSIVAAAGALIQYLTGRGGG